MIKWSTKHQNIPGVRAYYGALTPYVEAHLLIFAPQNYSYRQRHHRWIYCYAQLKCVCGVLTGFNRDVWRSISLLLGIRDEEIPFDDSIRVCGNTNLYEMRSPNFVFAGTYITGY